MKHKICFFSALLCFYITGISRLSAQQTICQATVTNQPVTASITTQPITQNKCLGSNVTFLVAATGTAPITYQWKKGGVDISGETSNSFTKSGLTLADEGIYTCEVTNLCRTVTSNNAELKVIQLIIDAGSDITFCNDTVYHIVATSSTNHPELGGLSYSWSPSAGLSDANILNPTAQPMTNTTYTLTVTDPVGCTITDVITLTSKTPVSITTQPLSYNKCLNSNVTFTTNTSGTVPITYIWKKGGTPITGATSNTYTINGLGLSDEAIYTCEPTNYCRTLISDDAELKVIQVSANAGADTRICNGQGTTLLASASSNHPAESGNYSYSWSPTAGLSSSTIYNPNAALTVTTNYTVQASDQLGCTATDAVNVLVQNVFQNEEICLVSVDTLVWKNKVMWEGTPDAGTAKYWIYREVVTNVYDWIGEVTYGSPTYFIDVASNPESHSDRYKIMVIDTCNNESDKSAYHNTMNLVISVFGSTMGLVWTEYETEDGSYIPDQYYIYKGTTPQTMTLLTTVTGSQNTYNDVNVFDLQYYMIGAHRNCNTDPAYSNKRDNGLVGINETSLIGTILIAPNPMTNTTTLTIPNFNSKIAEPLQIMDITGKVVKSISTSSDKFDNNKTEIVIKKGELKPGVYFVELKADHTYRGKLIIE